MRDWTGNAKSTFICNGASNHSDSERAEYDYYATEPKAASLLLEEEKFSETVWECACGEGHLSEEIKKHGYNVISTDIVKRGYDNMEIADFFDQWGNNEYDIITNPPYKYAKEFVEHALDISANGVKVAMFLKLTFLEGKKRKELFKKYPPKIIYVSSSRLQCAKNGDFNTYKKGACTAVAYAWYVWEKGFKCDPIIKWIN